MSTKFCRASRGISFAGSTLLAIGGLAANAAAQDVEIEVAPAIPPALHIDVAPGGGDGTAFRIVTESPDAWAPLVVSGANGGQLFYSQSFGEDPSSLLNWGNVQQELELIDEQREKIRDAQRHMQEKTQKHFAEMREQRQQRMRELQEQRGNNAGTSAPGGSNPGPAGGFVPRLVEPPADFQKTQEIMKQLREELKEKVDDVLLPHQRKRLEEISLRMKMKRHGTSGSLVNTELAKTLDIDDAQKERIRRKAIEVQQRLEEDIAKLREEAREEILDELSPRQKQQLKDMIGADFDERPKPITRPRVIDNPPPAVKTTEPNATPATDDEEADNDADSDAGANTDSGDEERR